MPSKYKKKIVIGRNIDGSAVYKNFGAPTKRELNEKIEEYKRKETLGILDVCPMSFSSWSDTWYETYIENSELSESSIYGYSLCVEHLKKAFNQIPLSQINTLMLQKFFNQKRNLSKSMVGKLKNTTKQIFTAALASGMLVRDPCLGVNFPSGKPPQDKHVYTTAEYSTVLKYAMEHDLGLGVFIILCTGFRCGELVGIIPRKDIGPDSIKMQRTVSSRGTPKLKSGGKSKNAERIVPLEKDGIFYEHLGHLGVLNTPDLLFKASKRKTGVLSPVDWSKQFYSPFTADLAADHPEIPILTPHELRHTYGTLLYKAGTPLDVIQKIMGHSTMDVTKQIYIHDDFNDMQQRFVPIKIENSGRKVDEKRTKR
ncbi:tyrosine-type recombinase/integrase [Eubacterium limosum]|uniref:tyrosine-type recombinase/integrase n=1 Tax=Eubacterium limosum TaxID=1736 RepID=UPI0037139544